MPSVDAMFRLHRSHVERVPYETLWIQLEQHWDTDPISSATRIAREGRGGYCFHLNGAFMYLLRQLGYNVTAHVGGVHGPLGPSPDVLTNHLVLNVSDLPSDDNPAGNWYLDVGLGDTLYDPLPLRPQAHRQGPFDIALESTPGGVGDWHLTHDPQGSFFGMAWQSVPTSMRAFDDRHRWLSTSPESGFVKVLAVQRRDATGADLLRGLSFTRVGTDAHAFTIASKAELFDVLHDCFGIDVAHFSPEVRAALWTKLEAAHAKWIRSTNLS